MACLHCRASEEIYKDMPIEQILKIIKFARTYGPPHKEVIVSGGEPLMHKQFSQILQVIRNNGGESVTLTTNGSLLTPHHLDVFEALHFPKLMLSVSLDSLVEQEHDSFRNYPCAYKKAIKAIKMIATRKIPNVVLSMRTTLQPTQIDSMEKMVRFARKLGCNRINFSSIHPAGKAISKPGFWMTKEQKKEFIEKIYYLKKIYSKDIQVDINDPLKCLIRGYNEIGTNDELIFDGCVAAAVTFNVSSNGNMTPCALMNLPIMNIFDLSVDEITKNYQQSDIVKNMLDMNLTGKCGACSKKYQCGGCRARAMIRNENYLAEDPDCWL